MTLRYLQGKYMYETHSCTVLNVVGNQGTTLPRRAQFKERLPHALVTGFNVLAYISSDPNVLSQVRHMAYDSLSPEGKAETRRRYSSYFDNLQNKDDKEIALLRLLETSFLFNRPTLTE